MLILPIQQCAELGELMSLSSANMQSCMHITLVFPIMTTPEIDDNLENCARGLQDFSKVNGITFTFPGEPSQHVFTLQGKCLIDDEQPPQPVVKTPEDLSQQLIL